MTLITYISILVIGGALLDLAFSNNERAQQIIYRTTLFAVWFLLVIRYYYGPDIAGYVPFYERLHPWYWHIAHPDYYEFERGFVLFCAALKGLGLSYYWLTAVITTLYFTAIALFFRKIKRHKTLALMILIIFDYNMIYQHRQCLSVSFFLFMILLMDNKKYLWALLCSFVAIGMHKSGIFMVSLVWMFYILHNNRLERGFFIVMLVLLCLMPVLPVAAVSSPFIHSLPLPDSFIKSIELHLDQGQRFQAIWAMYAFLITLIEFYFQHHTQTKRASEAVIIIGIMLIVLMYQYFYLLNRLRSFFLPVIITYLFCVIQDEEDNGVLVNSQRILAKYAGISLLLAYSIYRTLFFEIGIQKKPSRLHTPGGKHACSMCTVFDLLHKSPQYLRAERLYIAQCYWAYDYDLEQDKHKIKSTKKTQ